jgi:hypothetical protein
MPAGKNTPDSRSITITEQQGWKQAKQYMNMLRMLSGSESIYLVST